MCKKSWFVHTVPFTALMNVLFSELLLNASYWWNVGGNFSFGYLDAIY
jgi:hypothetical protein